MVLTFYILLNIAVLLFFFRYQKRNIHVLEVITYWLVATILFQNYTALFYMNFKYFLIPDILSLELANLMNRTILFPLLAILFLNRYIVLTTIKEKTLWLVCYTVILSSMEGLGDRLGILIHTHWKIGWSFSFWLFFLLALMGFMSYFRKKLNHGVPANEL